MANPPLPIDAVLPNLLAALRGQTGAVLIAPPGAGKTTAVAPALIRESWCTGTVVLLSPRRVAARAAAERMAELLGEKAGETVGYMTRMDSRVSSRTRVLVMTEAIFVNRIVAEPDLPGVSAVLFDEAHERHLDSDLGLAFVLETRSALRDDLRLLVMSATIDGTRFATLMGADTPVIESKGKAHTLDVRWLGSQPGARTEDAVARAILTAWRETAGDILAFLPGMGEIDRTRERLAERLAGVPILPLHGGVEPAAQRSAIGRDREGRRRIVLASAIAETSLTLDGVSVVVDSGLARRAEFDRAAGTNHLVTVVASRASADQRAGRAARQQPGVAYRLWAEAAHPGRPSFNPPEIETADLAPLVLALARWGESRPDRLAWLNSPPQASLDSATERLRALGALDADRRITAFGERLARLPMDPASAAMLLFAAERGQAEDGAQLALLLQERGLGGRGDDLSARLTRLRSERGDRAERARKLAAGWADKARKLVDTTSIAPPVDPALFLALARPDHVARRRDATGENWISAGGRGFVLDPSSPLARAEWLAIGDAQGQARGARITAACPLETEDIEAGFADRIERRKVLRWRGDRVEARWQYRLGAITLTEGSDPDPDEEAVAAMLIRRVREEGLDLLPFSPTSRALLTRARFAGVAALSPEELLAEAESWLSPLLGGLRSPAAVKPSALHDALCGRLCWNEAQALDRVAPALFTSPAGTEHPIDYDAEGGPQVEVRVQALFGLDRHPGFGSPPQPLLIQLTSPAGRPIQATRDLPGFWRGSWADVRREMKGRYPKHRWPERPWEEAPSLKTKNAFERDR